MIIHDFAIGADNYILGATPATVSSTLRAPTLLDAHSNSLAR